MLSMSDGISDANKGRDLNEILEAGAAWITDKELAEIGRDLRMFRTKYARLRKVVGELIEVLDQEGVYWLHNYLKNALYKEDL